MTKNTEKAAFSMLDRWAATCATGFELGGIRLLGHNLGRRKGEAADAWDCGYINRLYLDSMHGL